MISEEVLIGEGTQIITSSTINVGTKIGKHCIINTNSSIDHDCKIYDFVHIAPGVTICGGVSIGKSTLVGAGTTILPNVNVGENVVIGAGSLVNKDIPDNSKVLGSPAKIIENEKNRIFLSPPHVGKEEANNVLKAFSSNWISTTGPFVDEFEEDIAKYCKRKEACVVQSGTAAIHLAIRVLGISEGDTVLCQSLTFIGSCNPVVYEKANLIFIDSENDTWNMCPDSLRDALEDCKKEK